MVMRLSPTLQSTIRQAVADLAGPDCTVRLFGSRLDDAGRGGDVDRLLANCKPHMPPLFQRPFVSQLAQRLGASAPLVQVLVGPRQVGKTRGVRQLMGAELVQQPDQVFYWRERNDDVDFVYQYRDHLYAIEVKSGHKKSAKGLDAFCAQAPQALRAIVTPENFAQFSSAPRDFLRQVAV